MATSVEGIKTHMVGRKKNMQNSRKKRLRDVGIGMALSIWGCAILVSQLGRDMLYILAGFVVAVVFLCYISSIRQNDKYRETLSEKDEKKSSKTEKKTLVERAKFW